MITREDIQAMCGYDYYTPTPITSYGKKETKTPLQMVQEFASAMGQPLNRKYDPEGSLVALRETLVAEEYEEVMLAVRPVDILKELADLVYVTYGYAATFGWDLDEAVKRVHESNMSKLGDDGKPIYREDGKVMKSDNYKKPNLEDLV